MPEVKDDGLLQALRDARKVPRCFALILRGTDVVKLEVRKRPFRDAELAELRTEAKGNRVCSGVVRQAESGELLFESLDEPPEIKLQKIKEYVFEQTNLRISPRLAQVAALATIAEEVEVAEPAQQRWEAMHSAWAPRFVAALQHCADDQASRLRAAFSLAEEQAEAGSFEKAVQILERIAPVLRQALEGAANERKASSGKLVASRQFLLTRFKKIRAELQQALDSLQANMTRLAADEDPQELTDGIRRWFDELLERLQAGIDASIDEGDGFRTAQATVLELRAGLLSDDLLDHLLDNPLMGGEQFVDAIADGLDEIAREMATAGVA